MREKLTNLKNEKFIIYLLLVVFIITEIIDLLLDYLLGNSVLHSLLQLFLFLFLFLITYKIFVKYSDKKLKKLVPQELMDILKIINDFGKRGVLVNQRKMRESLNITKPTLKKRVDALLELQYISFEEKGNHRYFVLTDLGNSFVH